MGSLNEPVATKHRSLHKFDFSKTLIKLYHITIMNFKEFPHETEIVARLSNALKESQP